MQYIIVTIFIIILYLSLKYRQNTQIRNHITRIATIKESHGYCLTNHQMINNPENNGWEFCLSCGLEENARERLGK